MSRKHRASTLAVGGRLGAASRPLAFAFLIWSALIVVAEQVPNALADLLLWIQTAAFGTRAALLALLLGITALLLQPACRLILGWAYRNRWTEADSALVVGALIGDILMVLESTLRLPLAGAKAFTWFTIGFLVLAVLRRARIASSRPSRGTKSAEQPVGTLFGRILDRHSLAPLRSADEDQLERGPFVEELYSLVAEPRTVSLNVGLEGAWGSGKTSLFNLLRGRLEDAGFTVVSFNLWSYRHPERLVRVYFDALAGAIASKAPNLHGICLPSIGRPGADGGVAARERLGAGWGVRVVLGEQGRGLALKQGSGLAFVHGHLRRAA